MRKIIIAQYVSLDGVVEAPEEWHFPYMDQNMFRVLGEVNSEIDTMMLGRITYESFAATFANAPADDAIAAELNRPAKVLVSSTVTDPTWAKTTVISADVVAGVRALKESEGGSILINGSISLCQALLNAGLVEELHLLIHPIVVGHGRRLFEDNGPHLPLTVVSSETFPTGVLSVRFRTA